MSEFHDMVDRCFSESAYRFTRAEIVNGDPVRELVLTPKTLDKCGIRMMSRSQVAQYEWDHRND